MADNQYDFGRIFTPDEAKNILRSQTLMQAGPLTPEQLVGGSVRNGMGSTARPGYRYSGPMTTGQGRNLAGIAGNVDPMTRVPGIQDFDARLNQMTPDQLSRMAVAVFRDMDPATRQSQYPDESTKFDRALAAMATPPIQHSDNIVPSTVEPGGGVVPEATISPRQRATQLLEDLSASYGDLKPGSIPERINNIQDMNNAAMSIISGLSASGDPEDAFVAQQFSSAFQPMIQTHISALNLAQKYGNDAANNAITAMGQRMSYDVGLRNAATNAASLELDRWKVANIAIPQLTLQMRKYEEIDLPTSKLNEISTLATLAWNDMVNTQKMDLEIVKIGENIGQFETSRQDTARKMMIELQRGYTEFLSTNARALAQTAISAGSQFLESIPYIVSPAMEGRFLPGNEPGGTLERISREAGSTFTPRTYGDTIVGRFDPYAPVGQLQGSLAQAEAMYPQPGMDELMPPRESPGLDYLNQMDLGNYGTTNLMNSFLQMGGY